MYQDILIPTDGSDASETALEQGIAVASSVDATVHLLHVVNIETEMGASGVGTIADDLTDVLDEEARAALDRAEEMTEEAGVASERAVLEGVPEDAIVQYSEENDVDLVAVGESEDATVAERFFGTTTEDVLDSSSVSVLVARE